MNRDELGVDQNSEKKVSDVTGSVSCWFLKSQRSYHLHQQMVDRLGSTYTLFQNGEGFIILLYIC